jgi:hypothetical protein
VCNADGWEQRGQNRGKWQQQNSKRILRIRACKLIGTVSKKKLPSVFKLANEASGIGEK